MKIELKRIPRYKDAPDESCIWDLIVNGIHVGTYYGGKEKKYLDKEKWANDIVPKRIKVLQRNIGRLEDELQDFNNELISLSYNLV
jgi:hypothetical protein